MKIFRRILQNEIFGNKIIRVNVLSGNSFVVRNKNFRRELKIKQELRIQISKHLAR